tara:strand:- start:12485 stop:13828 length:1344 start_codon:yes stop_codon:yes gene_type:complete
MKKYEISRAVKFNLSSGQPLLDEFVATHRSFMHRLNKFFYNLLRDGELDLSQTSSRYYYLRALGKKVTPCKFISENHFNISSVLAEFKVDRVSYVRDCMHYVINRYLSFYKRNRKAIDAGSKTFNYIYLRMPEIHFQNQCASYDSEAGVVTLRAARKNHSLSFFYQKDNSFLKHLPHLDNSRKFAGNLHLKQGVFIARAVIPKQFQYNPSTALGMDINKTAEEWLVFSEPVYGRHVFSKPLDILELENILRVTNSELHSRFRKNGKVLKTGERPFGSRKARRLRKKVKSLHRRHKNAVIKFLRDEVKLLPYIQENSLLLCLDNIKTGQTQGTYGQDKITPYLIQECENREIPFVAPPTAYSSQRCPKCNHTSPANRPTTDKFKCAECGHSLNAHLVGAQNNARAGLYIWNNCADRKATTAQINKVFAPKRKRVIKLPPAIGRASLSA